MDLAPLRSRHSGPPRQDRGGPSAHPARWRGRIEREGLAAYDGDALTAYRQAPLACVLPTTKEQVSALLRYAAEEGVPIVPRGAGTSLSGGALPRGDAILLGLGRMNRILEIDYDNRCVVAEPGVTNLAITRAVEARGFYYAPDPSSQIACTVGGNVAENSGGIHCLKYGITTNNLLGVELALPGGERVQAWAARRPAPPAWICWASSPAPKACSASSSRPRCG